MKFKFFFILILLFIFCKEETLQDKIYISVSSDANTLDPIFTLDQTATKLNKLLFRKLFYLDDNLVLRNDLVKEFKIEQNSLFLKLNESILNSDDVKFSLDRLRTETNPKKSIYKNISSIEIISNSELKFKYTNLNLKDLDNLSFPVSSIYKKENYQENKKFISDGKYELLKWDKNNFLELKDKFNSKKIKIQVLNNSSSAIYLFKNNLLDLMKIPYFLITDSNLKNEKILRIKGKSFQYLAINHTNPCFDKNFRRAINLSINRKLILDKVFNSYAEITENQVPKKYFNNPKNSFEPEYDLEKAKLYLSNSKCFSELKQKEIEFRMRGDDENKTKGQAIATDLKKLGLKIKLLSFEKSNLYKENSEKKGDITLLTWYIDIDSITNFFDPIFASDQFGNGGNRSFYENEFVQSKILKFRNKTYDSNDILELMKFIKEENPIGFLWSVDEIYVYSEKISKEKELISIFTN